MYDNANTAETFSNILRELMQQNPKTGKKITQRALANFLGVSAQSVYLYCSGQVFPEYKQLLAIAEYFGVSVDYLLTGKQPENKSVRKSLHLSDKAIENLEFCDNDFAGFVDKLLSDKNFFIEYRKALQYIIYTKEFTTCNKKYEITIEIANGVHKTISREQMQENSILASSVAVYIYFKKFFKEILQE